MLYYFSELNIRGNHAGTKARNDVEAILKESGAKPLNSKQFTLRSDENDNIYSNVNSRISLSKLFFEVMKVRNQAVLLQYPMLAFDFEEQFYRAIAKKNRLILLVHDIHSLRIPNASKLKKEVELLNLADCLIVHNRFMKEKLLELGVTVSNVLCLQLFDYLYNNNNANNCITIKDDIAFAGNLDKSMFLPSLINENPFIRFALYGPVKEKQFLNHNATHYGSFSPDEIPNELNARFGLVWDGDSLNGASGALGEYTRINNPHKLSLYLASGIPVIVWRQAAVAEYVINKNIGFAVDRIDNLEGLLQDVTENDYIKMKLSVDSIRKEIIQGNFLKRVLQQLDVN